MSNLHYFIFVVLSVTTAGCLFEEYKAACKCLILGRPVEIRIVLNRCHDPIDLTFHVQAREPPVEWQHTFVTTNQAESQYIPGFSRKVALHVHLTTNDSREVLVRADYDADGVCENSFLDSAIALGDADACFDKESSLGGKVAIGIVALVSLTATGFYLCYRHRRNSSDLSALVEAGLPGVTPYQEGVPSPTKKNKMRYSLKVEYRKTHEPVVISNGYVKEHRPNFD